jgi:hypothetical protein
MKLAQAIQSLLFRVPCAPLSCADEGVPLEEVPSNMHVTKRKVYERLIAPSSAIRPRGPAPPYPVGAYALITTQSPTYASRSPMPVYATDPMRSNNSPPAIPLFVIPSSTLACSSRFSATSRSATYFSRETFVYTSTALSARPPASATDSSLSTISICSPKAIPLLSPFRYTSLVHTICHRAAACTLCSTKMGSRSGCMQL